jgi:eukaryotic-like serine/threonine-protein kinase
VEALLRRIVHVLANAPAGPLVAAVAVAGIWLMSGVPDASNRVPMVTGIQVNTAIAKASDAGYFADVVFRRGGGIAGTVIGQEPPAGALMNKQSRMTLVVTRGTAQVRVPDVRGIQVDEARRRLDRGNVIPGDVVYRRDAKRVSNHVITTVPAPGKLVDAYTKVEIIAAA